MWIGCISLKYLIINYIIIPKLFVIIHRSVESIKTCLISVLNYMYVGSPLAD